ncbi:hypothetical protein HK102_005775 [Quaeritorhiza haematococci]|nr:hypothetical protein HK102_005775 [Quaeritorhiza haematococci]
MEVDESHDQKLQRRSDEDLFAGDACSRINSDVDCCHRSYPHEEGPIFDRDDVGATAHGANIIAYIKSGGGWVGWNVYGGYEFTEIPRDVWDPGEEGEESAMGVEGEKSAMGVEDA